jgi:hypothetical protein
MMRRFAPLVADTTLAPIKKIRSPITAANRSQNEAAADNAVRHRDVVLAALRRSPL